MNRETYETYSAAEPEKIDLIAFLAEYFRRSRNFFLWCAGTLILAGGGSFLTAKLRYQPVYEGIYLVRGRIEPCGRLFLLR